MDCSTPGLPVHHPLPEFTQTHVQPMSLMSKLITNPLNWWCHPTISSSVIPFSSHLQSFPVSGSFQVMNLIYLLAVLCLDYSYDPSVFWQFLALIPLPLPYLQLFLCARNLASIPHGGVGISCKNVFLQLTFSQEVSRVDHSIFSDEETDIYTVPRRSHAAARGWQGWLHFQRVRTTFALQTSVFQALS